MPTDECESSDGTSGDASADERQADTDRGQADADESEPDESHPGESSSDDGPTAERVVEVAAEAAEDVIFGRLDAGEVDDVDVTARFEDGVLDVDVYLHAPDSHADEAQIADDAAMAARAAVDDLF